MRKLDFCTHVFVLSTFLIFTCPIAFARNDDNGRYQAKDSRDRKRPPIHYRPKSNVSWLHNSRIESILGAYPNVIVSDQEIDFISPLEPILAPCTLLLRDFTEVAMNFTKCVTTNSLPPNVCTRCADHYVALEQAYYVLKDSTEAKSTNGMPCDQVIFSLYETIYVDDIYNVLTGDIWLKSRCGDCLEFIISPQLTSTGDFEIVPKPAGNYRYNNRTEQLLLLRQRFYDCIAKTGGTTEVDLLQKKNATVVCGQCWHDYERLNMFFEESIMLKHDFCVDIDSTVNDTIRYWRQELACALPALPSKNSEAVFVALIALALFTLTILFYSGSFMQGTVRKRRLKKYRGRFHYGSTSLGVNNDVIEEFINERTQRQISEPSRPTERTPLFARGRRVISFSQLPPSNLG